MTTLLKNFAADERGASSIEYALIAALIALVIISGAQSLGGAISTRLTKIGTSVTNAK